MTVQKILKHGLSQAARGVPPGSICGWHDEVEPAREMIMDLRQDTCCITGMIENIPFAESDHGCS